MDVLDYISECALRVNGKVKLACSTEIAEENMLEITLMNSNVLRDLVNSISFCSHVKNISYLIK